MKKALLGGLLALLFAVPAQAEMPMPTCEQMKAGYELLGSGPISAEDGTLDIAVKAFADNQLLAHDSTKQTYATRERIATYLKSLSPMDALLWVGKQHYDLEAAMQRNKCAYTHKDIVLKSPVYKANPNAKSCGGPIPDLSKTPR